MDTLDMLANNLANAATPGYKTDREAYGLYFGEEAGDADETGMPASSSMPDIRKNYVDLSPGVIQPTGNPLDLALTGRGFFVVKGPAGPLYTRNGTFRLSAGGALVSQEGYAVQSNGGGSIQSQSSGTIEVSPDGTVMQEGAVLGQIDIADFADASKLTKQGGAYLQNPDQGMKPFRPSATEVMQGSIEGSNVVVSESTVRLITAMRQFEMLQKAISLSGEMNRRSVEEVARVSS